MKKLLLILLVLLVAVAAGTTFYINTIDWNKHKNIIAQQFNEATGKQIVFAGPISFKIFPTPYLNAADIKILNPTGGDKDKPLVEIRDLVARLSLMPLLQGRFDIQRMELRNPQINVEILPDGKLNWQSELDPEQRRAIEESHFALNSVSIGSATLNFEDQLHDTGFKLENLNGEIVAQSVMGPYRIEGNYTKDNIPEGFAISLGQLSDSFATTLNLVVTHPTSESYVRFDGSFTLANKVANGNIIIDSKKLNDFWNANIKSVPFASHFNYPVAITSDINITPQQLNLSNIVIKYGSTQGAGNLQMPFNDGFGNGGIKPRIDLAFNFTDLDLTPLAETAQNFIKDHAQAETIYNPELDFDILADIKSVRTSYKNQQIKNFEASFDMVENIMTINNINATLPGDTDINLKGTISAFENQPFYNLDTSLNSNDFLKTLTWLDLAPQVSTASTYRKAIGNAKLSGTLQRIQISPFKFTLDKSSLSGEAGIKRGSRNDILLLLNTDMINFDNYISSLPAEEHDKNWAQRMAYRFSKLGFLNDFDLQLTANMDVGIYEKMPFEKVTFQGSLLDGKLEIGKLQIGSVANAKIELSGNLSGFGKSPIFDNLNYNIQTNNIAALINKMEFKAPNLDYKKLNDLKVIGAITGDINHFATNTAINFEDLVINYNGQVNRLPENTSFSGDLEIKHPDFNKMLTELGFSYTPAAQSLGIFNLKTGFKGSEQQFDAQPLAFNIGFNTFNGRLGYEESADKRPQITTDLEVNKLELERFLQRGENAANQPLIDIQSDSVAEFLQRPLWSKNKIDYGFYHNFDLNGKFKFQELSYQNHNFSNVIANLVAKQGIFEVSNFAADYLGGKAEAAVKLDSNDKSSLSGNFKVIDADTAHIISGGNIYALTGGKFAASFNFDSSAASQYDFISGLKAEGDISFNNVAVKGWNLAAIHQDIISRETSDGLSNFVRENLTSGNTEFDKISGHFNVANGKFKLSKSIFDNKDNPVNLSGDGDLVEWTMNTLFDVKYSEPQYLPGFSFSLKGPINAPNLDVDVSALFNLYKSRQDKKEADIKAAVDAYQNHLQSQIDEQKKMSEALIADIDTSLEPDIEHKKQTAFDNDSRAVFANISQQLAELKSTLAGNLSLSTSGTTSEDTIKELSAVNQQATADVENLRSKINDAALADIQKNIKTIYNQIIEGYNRSKMLSFQYNSEREAFNARLSAIITDFKLEEDNNISGWQNFIEDKIAAFEHQDKELLDKINLIKNSSELDQVEQYKSELQNLRDALELDLQNLQQSLDEYKDYTDKKISAQETAYANKLREEEIQRKLEENTGSISIKKSGRTVTIRRDIEEIEKAEELAQDQEVKVLDFSKPKIKLPEQSPSSNINVVKKGRAKTN